MEITDLDRNLYFRICIIFQIEFTFIIFYKSGKGGRYYYKMNVETKT